MLSGSYTGDGTDNRPITELNFTPDVVIVKADATQIAVIRTSDDGRDAAKPMTGATGLTANLIQSLDNRGFTLGTDPRVNGNGTEYYWIAFKANPGKMKVGLYVERVTARGTVAGVGFYAETALSCPRRPIRLSEPLPPAAAGWILISAPSTERSVGLRVAVRTTLRSRTPSR